jgi:hypothetical protein
MISNIYNKYDQSTLSKFDIIGSYFVNLYYNEFYIKSKNLKFDSVYNNITEGYKNVLSSYLEFTKKAEFFKQIIKGIHTYCISTTRYTTMTHKECIDFMVYEFVPSNLWSALRENQKNKLFHESIVNCITIFTEKIISNHLHIIIDHRDQPENITILQDLFLSIILFEKDKIFSKFLNPNNKDSNHLELFRDKIKSILQEKKKIQDDNKKLQKKNEILDNLVKKNANVITELQKTNKLLIQKLELIQVDNMKLKLQLDLFSKQNNTNNNTLPKNNSNISLNNSNSDNESIKNISDTDSLNNNLSKTNSIKNGSDNESDDFNVMFNETKNNNTNNLSKFIQKKNTKKT